MNTTETHSNTDKTTVFISYYRGDTEISKKIVSLLKARPGLGGNYSVFLGEDGLHAGSEWLSEIRKRLVDSEHVILICSPTSITRPWVAFEIGMALQLGKNVCVYCHSGMNKEQITLLSKQNDSLCEKIEQHAKPGNIVEASEEDAIDKLYEKLNLSIRVGEDEVGAPAEHEEDNDSINLLLRHGRSESERRKKKEPPERYVYCELIREKIGGAIRIEITDEEVEYNERPVEESRRIENLINMNKFLDGSLHSVKTGVAIGIQNCIYRPEKDSIEDALFVGVRYKSLRDPTASSTSLSKGEFNTGYKLIRNPVRDRDSLRSIDKLQDLFVSQQTKYLVQPEQKISNEDYPFAELDRNRQALNGIVYQTIQDRLKIFGTQLYKIQLLDHASGGQQYGYGSLLVNNSTWFPRFEIGVWKYMEIGDYESVKEAQAKRSAFNEQHYVKGFGEDLFQDYRGNIDNPTDKLNFWIWCKDGEIHYRSYPEERFLPRLIKKRRTDFEAHRLMISQNDLTCVYGINDKFTQFAPDEVLERVSPDAIMKTLPSLPAVRLLTWF